MDQFKALQILALKEVTSETPSADFQLRSIFRWYSKTFHTPLHVVYTLPEYDILQAYYEDIYEELNESSEGQPNIHRLMEELSKTDEELAKERSEKDKEAVWEYQERKFVAEHNAKAGTKTPNNDIAKKKLERDRKAAQELERLANQDAIGAKIDFEKSIEAPIMEAIKDFEMNFGGLDLGDLGDLDANSLLGIK